MELTSYGLAKGTGGFSSWRCHDPDFQATTSIRVHSTLCLFILDSFDLGDIFIERVKI